METQLPRILVEDDYEDVLALWQRSGLPIRPRGRDGKTAFARQLASGVVQVLGLYDGPHLVAVVVATHDSRRGYINRLAVDPAYRRRGLARTLIAAAESWFLSLEIEIWTALIEEGNDASLALMQQAGYQVHRDITYVSKRTRDTA